MSTRFGIENPRGSQNCFLNSVLEMLWHLHGFRKRFTHQAESTDAIKHEHEGPTARDDADACFFCAFREFWSLATACSGDNDDIITLSSVDLRLRLAMRYHARSKFQYGETDDAGECLDAILVQLHNGLTLHRRARSARGDKTTATGATPGTDVLHFEALEACAPPCLIHELFGISVVEYTECDAGHLGEPSPTIQGVLYVLGQALLQQSRRHSDEFGWGFTSDAASAAFEHAVRESVDRRHDRCDCGHPRVTKRSLLQSPRYLFIATTWADVPYGQSYNDYVRMIPETISPAACFDSNSTATDSVGEKGLPYDGNPDAANGDTEEMLGQSRLTLCSVVCYVDLHYVCYARHLSGTGDHEHWWLYDDAYVHRVGSYEAVQAAMGRNAYLPVLLGYSAVPRTTPPTRIAPTPARERDRVVRQQQPKPMVAAPDGRTTRGNTGDPPATATANATAAAAVGTTSAPALVNRTSSHASSGPLLAGMTPALTTLLARKHPQQAAPEYHPSYRRRNENTQRQQQQQQQQQQKPRGALEGIPSSSAVPGLPSYEEAVGQPQPQHCHEQSQYHPHEQQKQPHHQQPQHQPLYPPQQQPHQQQHPHPQQGLVGTPAQAVPGVEESHSAPAIGIQRDDRVLGQRRGSQPAHGTQPHPRQHHHHHHHQQQRAPQQQPAVHSRPKQHQHPHQHQERHLHHAEGELGGGPGGEYGPHPFHAQRNAPAPTGATAHRPPPPAAPSSQQEQPKIWLSNNTEHYYLPPAGVYHCPPPTGSPIVQHPPHVHHAPGSTHHAPGLTQPARARQAQLPVQHGHDDPHRRLGIAPSTHAVSTARPAVTKTRNGTLVLAPQHYTGSRSGSTGSTGNA